MHHPRQHGLYNSNYGALAKVRNSLMGPPRGIDPMTHCTLLADALLLSYILIPVNLISLKKIF